MNTESLKFVLEEALSTINQLLPASSVLLAKKIRNQVAISAEEMSFIESKSSQLIEALEELGLELKSKAKFYEEHNEEIKAIDFGSWAKKIQTHLLELDSLEDLKTIKKDLSAKTLQDSINRIDMCKGFLNGVLEKLSKPN